MVPNEVNFFCYFFKELLWNFYWNSFESTDYLQEESHFHNIVPQSQAVRFFFHVTVSSLVSLLF